LAVSRHVVTTRSVVLDVPLLEEPARSGLNLRIGRAHRVTPSTVGTSDAVGLAVGTVEADAVGTAYLDLHTLAHRVTPNVSRIHAAMCGSSGGKSRWAVQVTAVLVFAPQ
jgi:hypothetical protein